MPAHGGPAVGGSAMQPPPASPAVQGDQVPLADASAGAQLAGPAAEQDNMAGYRYADDLHQQEEY